MPLPTLIKTWEHRNNVAVPLCGQDGDLDHRRLCVAIKNILTDTVAHMYGAPMAIQLVDGPSNTYRVNPNPGSANVQLDPAFTGSLAGKTVKIRGMPTTANDGDFTITAHTDLGGGEWVVEYVNSGGATPEASIDGSANVIGGNFSFPWVLDHTTTTIAGTQNDGIDRLVGTMRFDSNTLFDSWVIRNPVTGTYWGMAGNNSASTLEGVRGGTMRQVMNPKKLEPAGVGAIPSGEPSANGTATHVQYHNGEDNFGWFNNQNVAQNFRLHMQMSNDGEQTRLLACSLGNNPLIFIDAVVDNPHPLWTGSTPTVACMSRQGGNSNRGTYAIFNDSNHFNGSAVTEPKGLSTWGESLRYNPSFYTSVEGYGSAANGQNWTGANELSGKYDINPVALVGFEVGIKGRMGEIPDLWFCPTALSLGHTFPEDNSRQFLVIEDLVIPWDGSVPEFS